MIQWQVIFATLQQHPDWVEPDLHDQIAELARADKQQSAKHTSDKTSAKTVLNALQKQLGNFRMQQLFSTELAGEGALSRIKEHAIGSSKELGEAPLDSASIEERSKQTTSNTLAKSTMQSAAQAPNNEHRNQPSPLGHITNPNALNKVVTKHIVLQKSDPVDHYQRLQSQLIAELPNLPVNVLGPLKNAFHQLTPALQSSAIEELRKNSLALNSAEKTQLFQHLQHLPSSLAKSTLVTRLWVALTGVFSAQIPAPNQEEE